MNKEEILRAAVQDIVDYVSGDTDFVWVDDRRNLPETVLTNGIVTDESP